MIDPFRLRMVMLACFIGGVVFGAGSVLVVIWARKARDRGLKALEERSDRGALEG